MKAAPGSPGPELPGEPDAGRVADRRLVAGGPDALPDPADGGREPEHRRRQGGRRSLPGRAAEDLDGRVQVAEERRAHRQRAVILIVNDRRESRALWISRDRRSEPVLFLG